MMKNSTDESKAVNEKPKSKIALRLKVKLRKKNATKKSKKQTSSKSLLQSLITVLVVIIFLVEFSFAISVYVFKSVDVVTSYAIKIIPYPAVFTTSGVVTVAEYRMEKKYIQHFYESTKQTDYDPAQLAEQIRKEGAENRILEREAIAYKVKVSSSEVSDAMKTIYDGNGGEEEVRKALVDLYGLTVDEFKDLVKTQLLRDKINKEVIAHVEVRHILIRVEEGASQEKIDEAKARIDGYVTEIKNGLSFEEAAKKYSEDTGSNEDGGKLESFARGDMVEEFEDVAFSTDVNQMSEPFRTSFGWHILIAENKTGYVQDSFDNWIAGLINKSYVTYLYKDE